MATIKSIKEKAKAYDKAIEKAKNCLKDGTITNTAISYIETIFPELKESEDEMIRACIGMCLTDIDEQRFADFNTNLKECRAWLEKQGEHANFLSKIQVGDKLTMNEDGVLVNLTQLNRVVNKGIEKAIKAKQGEQKPKVNLHVKCIAKVEPFDKYEGLTDFERSLADICIGWIGEEPGWKQYIKDNADVLLKIAIKKFNSVQDAPFEQKSAWSEEDETNLRRTEYAVMKFFGGDCSLVGWLRKSLKERYNWKPSDEQMNTLEYYTHTLVCNEHKEILFGLYADLKKLKG